MSVDFADEAVAQRSWALLDLRLANGEPDSPQEILTALEQLDRAWRHDPRRAALALIAHASAKRRAAQGREASRIADEVKLRAFRVDLIVRLRATE